MTIRAIVTSYAGSSPESMPDVTSTCLSYNQFCEEIDSFVSRLNELKAQAKIKFDEFKAN